jgi:hypothetical protein
VRCHDDRGRFWAEEKFLVLSQEEEVRIKEALANAVVRRAPPTDRDDVLDCVAVALQSPFKTERLVFVEEDSHDGWRTAGGR